MSVRSADHLLAGARPDPDERLGEGARVLLGLHEGPAADLHVEHQPVDPLGELLGQDGRDDEGDALDGRRHVAEGIDALVGGGDLRRLPDHAAAHLGHDAREVLGRELGREAGDGLELVERSAGVTEAAAAHHRDRDAARGDERGEGERDLVADAAGGVLVDLEALDAREIEDAAAPEHRVGEGDGLRVVEAAEEDRHEPRGHLVVGEVARGERRRRGARSRRERASRRRASRQ